LTYIYIGLFLKSNFVPLILNRKEVNSHDCSSAPPEVSRQEEGSKRAERPQPKVVALTERPSAAHQFFAH